MGIEPKIAVVTGANSGLGYETAKGLAAEDYKVVMACRSLEKAETAALEIKRSVQSADLICMRLDLVDRNSVRAFAKAFNDNFDRLDLLVNNAGIVVPPYTITENNLELQFDANHVGHFLLTSLLMPKLNQPHETRIISVSSLAAREGVADIYFDNLNFEGTYDEGPRIMGVGGVVAYAQSKLANLLFMQELKNRLDGKGMLIKPVAVHPGVANTGATRNLPFLIRFLLSKFPLIMPVSSPQDGAQPSLFAALSPDLRAGDFIGPTKKKEQAGPPGTVPLPEKALDAALLEQFWELSEELIGEEFQIPASKLSCP